MVLAAVIVLGGALLAGGAGLRLAARELATPQGVTFIVGEPDNAPWAQQQSAYEEMALIGMALGAGLLLVGAHAALRQPPRAPPSP